MSTSTKGYRQRYPEIECQYELCETLGSGGFAKVKAAVHKLTGEKVAIKIMDKLQLGADLPRVYREIRALKKLHHQHICQMFQIIETERMIHLVLEFCPGGELFDYIVAKEHLKEREARSFFRQIVSALYFIHQCGFIHRDLKPENLLLDEDSNIKLIDFGLVAEPEDTMDLLQTCCGSPAYAAPELIRGGPYVGPQADVWSLGVLLYALLNGFLPFDDDYTPRLYQLIQKGEYETPEWLSIPSIGMLARLLRTDPLKRVTVEGLLRDPWVMKGYESPVLWQSKIEMDHLDQECVKELARYYQMSEVHMREDVLKWNYDEVTATYFLLLQQKLHGKSPTITAAPKKTPSTPLSISPLTFSSTSANIGSMTGTTNKSLSNNYKHENEAEQSEESTTPSPAPFSPIPPSSRTRRISLGQQIHPPKGELVTIQKPMYPAISTIRDDDEIVAQISSLSPPPSHETLNIAPSLPLSNTMEFQTVKKPVKKTISFESRLQYAVKDERRATLDTGVVLSTPRRGRLGSLELIFKKAKKAFGKKQSDVSGPRKVKGIYDMSTTSNKSAEEVVHELERVLMQLSITYEKTGYLFQCSVPSYKDSTSTKKDRIKWIKFDLEICLLPPLEMLGVRRKRIKGDIWEYKRVCDQIFKATHF